MVQTFGADANNDLYLGTDGNIAILSGAEAVAAACSTKTKAQLGEMVFETTQGIPNFQAVFTGVPNYPVFQAYLRNNILSIDGVTGIESIFINPVKNTLNYTARIQSIYGAVKLNG